MDMLSTEKYVSSSYDIAIFECTNPQVRDVLNHIQKEEQQHGEAIFKYLETKGMYQAK
jgi:spore coat protein CotF